MKFVASEIEMFGDYAENKKIVCFGASKHLINFVGYYGKPRWFNNIICFVDNDRAKRNTFFTINSYKWKIFEPDYLQTINDDVVILITTASGTTGESICKQLLAMGLNDKIECYSLLQMEMKISSYDNTVMQNIHCDSIQRIPKKIHCFWFSGEEKPNEYVECINSWKKFCPDYEIIEWNSENYDVGKNRYMKEAFEAKKWAFVSDYARLDVIYRFGGIYMDMDVEVLKNLDDLLQNKAYFFFDNAGYIDFGSGFGSEKGNVFLNKLIRVYDDLEFELNDKSNEKTQLLPQPMLLLSEIEKFGYKRNMKSQIVKENLFMSPTYCKVVDDSTHLMRNFSGMEYAVHWHHAGWFDELMRQERIDKNEFLHRFS